MTFQDRRKLGEDWEKVKNKRKMQHPTDEVSANNPKSVFEQFNEPTVKPIQDDKSKP